MSLHTHRFPKRNRRFPKRNLHPRRYRRRHAPYLTASSRAEMALGRVRPIPSSNAAAARTSCVGGCRRRAFHVVRPAFHSVLQVGSRGSTRRGGAIPGFTALVRWSRTPSNRNSLRQTRSDHVHSPLTRRNSYVVLLEHMRPILCRNIEHRSPLQRQE